MLKQILVTVVVIIVLLVLGVGAYFMFANNKATSPLPKENANPNSFEIQGMKVEILRQGTGVGAQSGDYVTVHYVGTLENGKEFDSSVKRNQPFTFILGQGKVIKGWDLGVAGMKVGEERRLTVPPELGYGANGFPPIIPPKSNLIFVIDVLRILPPPKSK